MQARQRMHGSYELLLGEKLISRLCIQDKIVLQSQAFVTDSFFNEAGGGGNEGCGASEPVARFPWQIRCS